VVELNHLLSFRTLVVKRAIKFQGEATPTQARSVVRGLNRLVGADHDHAGVDERLTDVFVFLLKPQIITTGQGLKDLSRTAVTLRIVDQCQTLTLDGSYLKPALFSITSRKRCSS